MTASTFRAWASLSRERRDGCVRPVSIRQQVERFRIRAIAYDPWNCESLRLQLESDGIEMVEFHQQLRHFSEPFKEYLARVAGGKIRHGGNPVLRWMAANLAATEDSAGNIRPDKGKSRDKIDGQVAAIMALGLTMFAKPQSVYETRGLIEI